MKLLVFKSKKEAVRKACSEVQNLISRKPNAVLGLATGGTMVPFYKELVKLCKKGKIDLTKVTTFNLDEYAGLNHSDKNSYHYYMNKNFFSKVGITKSKTNFPSVSGSDYDKKIKRAGGLDLCMLGIGRNGHIAFNEPGSSFKSRTRKVELTGDTIKANSRYFKTVSRVPREAYTMGIATIMNSKKIILLAFGEKKSSAIARVMKGKVSESVPASILRRHKDATLIANSRAASQLSHAAVRLQVAHNKT